MSYRIRCILVLIVLVAGPAAYGDKEHKKAKDRGPEKAQAHSSTTVDIDVVLGDYRRIVREYAENPPSGSLPPGLAKRGGDLPPGLQKQLRKNGTLPPGLQKKLSPYPRDLAARLRPLGNDYQGGFLHGRVVVFNRRTSAILDVFIP